LIARNALIGRGWRVVRRVNIARITGIMELRPGDLLDILHLSAYLFRISTHDRPITTRDHSDHNSPSSKNARKPTGRSVGLSFGDVSSTALAMSSHRRLEP
jgi:hypothetical protein